MASGSNNYRNAQYSLKERRRFAHYLYWHVLIAFTGRGHAPTFDDTHYFLSILNPKLIQKSFLLMRFPDPNHLLEYLFLPISRDLK